MARNEAAERALFYSLWGLLILGVAIWRFWPNPEDGWKKLTGMFWATAKYRRPFSQDSALPEDFFDWTYWETWETTLPTRAAAIEAVLRKGMEVG